MSEKKLGFIGCGNMAGAILDGILASGILKPSDIVVFDISEKVKEEVIKKGVEVRDSIVDLCSISEKVLLGIKPNTTKNVLNEAGKTLEGKAILSIVAGISSDTLQEWAGVNVRVLRIMPNTPAMVGAGATVLCSDTSFTEEEKVEAEKYLIL